MKSVTGANVDHLFASPQFQKDQSHVVGSNAMESWMAREMAVAVCPAKMGQYGRDRAKKKLKSSSKGLL